MRFGFGRVYTKHQSKLILVPIGPLLFVRSYPEVAECTENELTVDGVDSTTLLFADQQIIVAESEDRLL